MQKIHKGIIAIAIVIVITGFVFYQYAAKIFQVTRQETVIPAIEKPESKKITETVPLLPSTTKEVSVVTTYDVPEAEIVHNVKFTVVVDSDGRVVEMQMVEMPKGVASDKQKEFAVNLTSMIQGKKLAEIARVDKVGKSTLTTDAFNRVIPQLQAQLR